jgi:hypothetical protein
MQVDAGFRLLWVLGDKLEGARTKPQEVRTSGANPGMRACARQAGRSPDQTVGGPDFRFKKSVALKNTRVTELTGTSTGL